MKFIFFIYRLKCVTVIFRKYAMFCFNLFQIPKFHDTSSIEPDFVSKFYIYFDVCLILTRE